MTLDQLPSGAEVFLDANILILVLTAARLSRQHELLSGDALIVAVMHAHGLTDLASNDADFDRVPGLIRYAPA